MILIFYLGISAYLHNIGLTRPDYEFQNFIENVKNEYPRAFNLGLNNSMPIETLYNFTIWCKEISENRGINLKILWIVTWNVSEDLNVTVGNFMGYKENLTIEISGEKKDIVIDDGKINSLFFEEPPSNFSLKINFNTKEKNVILEKHKFNIYLFLEAEKNGDKIVEEIKA